MQVCHEEYDVLCVLGVIYQNTEEFWKAKYPFITPKFPLAFVQVHILVDNFCVEGLEKQKLTVLRTET